ncbi:MAG: hypothetical protein ACOZNI_27320 [Myxococcota bacterium]
MLHEGDLIAYGTEGWGLMQIEHLVPRSEDVSLIGEYRNLIYICRLCNGSRSDTPRKDPVSGARLLDPTEDVWAAHFDVTGDTLLPMAGDTDAEYTADVYDINDPRKVALRRARREAVVQWLQCLADERYSTSQLGALAITGDPDGRSGENIRPRLRRIAELAFAELSKRRWIPGDAPVKCRCGGQAALSLPPAYARQVIRVSR